MLTSGLIGEIIHATLPPTCAIYRKILSHVMIDLTSQVFQYEIEFAISLKCIEQVDNERTL